MFETDMDYNSTNLLIGDRLWEEMFIAQSTQNTSFDEWSGDFTGRLQMGDFTDRISAADRSITTEHSYSLNSEGNSAANSPNSLNSKLTDFDDEFNLPMDNFNTLIDEPLPTLASASLNYKTTNKSRHHVDVGDDDHQMSVGLSINGDRLGQAHNLPHEMETDLFGRLLVPPSQSQLSAGDEIDDDDDLHGVGGSSMDLDDSCIKPEPLSASSSRPNSPDGNEFICQRVNAAFSICDNANEKKVSPKVQQMLLTTANIQIKTEAGSHGARQQAGSATTHSNAIKTSTPTSKHNGGSNYGTPLTPCSLQSDEYEDGNGTLRASSSRRDSTSSMSSTASSFKSGRISKRRHMRTKLAVRKLHNTSQQGSSRQPIHTPLISSQPKNSTGPVILTEEEIRVYTNEKLLIPTTFPLTKEQEKTLKGVRRKIKNKISAQESRRKKKEYVEQLEQKLNELAEDNVQKGQQIEELQSRELEQDALIAEYKSQDLAKTKLIEDLKRQDQEKMKFVNRLKQMLDDVGIKLPTQLMLLDQKLCLKK